MRSLKSPADARRRTFRLTSRHDPRHGRQRPGIVLAVAAGGVIGAPARYELGLLIPSHSGAFPLSTLIINVTGSLLLGLFLTLIVERWRPTEYLRPFVATGILGAYTTWSSFMVDTVNLLRKGHPAVAVGYVGASLAAGLGAVYVGMLLARTGLLRMRSSHRKRASK